MMQVEKKLDEFDKYEKHACDSEYLKQKEDQYAKLYYQMSKMRDPSESRIPLNLINTL